MDNRKDAIQKNTYSHEITWKKVSPNGSITWTHGAQLSCNFERLMNCALVGGSMSLEKVLEKQTTQSISSGTLCFMSAVPGKSSQFTPPSAIYGCSPLTMISFYSSETIRSNKLFYKLHWSWYSNLSQQREINNINDIKNQR